MRVTLRWYGNRATSMLRNMASPSSHRVSATNDSSRVEVYLPLPLDSSSFLLCDMKLSQRILQLCETPKTLRTPERDHSTT
jgi:hypothetical protein